MLELLTFDGFLRHIEAIHKRPNRKWKFIVFCAAYQLYSITLMIRYEAFIMFCKTQKDREDWLDMDTFVYYFAIMTMNNNKMLVICAMALMLYGCCILQYCFFYFYRIEQIGADNFIELDDELKRRNLNVAFLARKSRPEVKKKFREVSQNIPIDLTPFSEKLGRYAYVISFVKTKYFYNVFAVLLCVAILLFYILQVSYQMLYLDFPLWWHRSWILIEYIFIAIITGTPILCPAFALAYFSILFGFVFNPLQLQNRTIQRSLQFSTDYGFQLGKVSLFKLIRHYHRIFLFNYRICQRINGQSVGTMYNVTLWLNLFSNVCFIIVLMSQSVTPGFRLWVGLITVFQFAMVFASLNMLLWASNLLYCARRSIREGVVRIFCERSSVKLSRMNCLKLCQSYEILCPRVQFRFTLGPVGRISPKSLMAFFPMYSTFFLKIIPFFIDKKKDS